MADWQRLFANLAWMLALFVSVPVHAITIQIDYRYDTTALGGSNFFGSGNPQGAASGAQARNALDAAASYFSNILDDTFSAITIPAPYHSTLPGSNGVVTWNWEERLTHPSGTSEVAVSNPTVGANQYIIYAGSRNMTGSTAGVGGPGGFLRPSPTITGTNTFTQSDINQIQTITANFDNAIQKRGEPSGFANWGGTISFDRSDRTWHFNHTTAPSGNVTDFYSVAIHELAHALGFGQRDNDPENFTAWESHVSVSSGVFTGSNASSEYGGAVPLWTQNQNLSHWAPGTASVIYGTSIAQETAMDPDLTQGSRKRFTALDAAAMKDIGWTVVAPPPLPGVNGDYNNNGSVDAADYVIWRKRLGQSVTLPNDATPGTVTTADYTVWRNNFGDSQAGTGASSALEVVPEPGGLTLLILACAAAGLGYNGRRR